MKNLKTNHLSKIKKSRNLFLAAIIMGVFGVTLMFEGCYKDSVQPTVIPFKPHSTDTTSNDTAATVHYVTDIQPVLSANCVGCHSFFSSYASLMAYSPSLVNTSTPSSSLIYVKIHSGSMVQYAPTGFDATVLTWITEGAHNN